MFKEIVVVLMALTITHGHSSLILPRVERNFEVMEYMQVAFNVTKRFIIQHTNTLIIMHRCEYLCKEQEQHHKVMLENFLHNLTYDLTIQLYFAKPHDRPWDYNMFIIDSWRAFEALRFHFPPTKHERQFYFLILLTWHMPGPDSVMIHMHRIFLMCLNFNVKNVVIMYRRPKERHISFYSYQLFGPNHCHERITIEEVNRYEGGRLLHDFLFPRHMYNFHGCTLPVSGHIMDPLLSFNGDVTNETHLADMKRLSGIEGEIFKIVAKVLNFKIKMRFPSGFHYIGLHMNSTGCFADLEREQAQIALGGFSVTMRNSHRFSHSFAHHTTPYVFVVRGGLLFGPIKQLLNPLCYNTWLLLLGLALAAIIFTVTVERYWKPTLRNFIFGPCNPHPLRNMTVVFLGSPIPGHIVPTRNFARFLFMGWLLLTFELRNGYQGKLFDSLRLAKRLPVPQKISELIAQDYTLISSVYTKFYPANKTKILLNSRERMEYVNTSEKRLTTMTLLDILIRFNVVYPQSSALTYVDENIHFYQCVLFFPKHSILRPSFDRTVKRLTDAGITSYIALRRLHRHYVSPNFRGPKPMAGQITNRHLQGLYSFYAILCGLATFVFMLEVLTRKSSKLKVLMDWLN